MDDLVERALPQDTYLGEGSVVGMAEPPRVPAPKLTFMVDGKPEPKGSKSLYQGRLVESAKGYPAWAHAVGMSALAAKRRQRIAQFEGPVTAVLSFHLLRPKQPKNKTHHITKPDLDKLIRGVLDPLTGIVFDDDAQVDTILATKHYVEAEPYVYVQIGETIDRPVDM